ncbi:alpha/beta hydrolase [Actinoplanes sp. NBRC 101535]|uniref:alpha/beta hydrolase n=1 Tax=Actinoplanes sp. NBRC 101535 TaxID=3032196 RepID=UPI0024A546DC|nr:alpha/beta hydrolase [Actinoplanes sp. NBRC 101535]GLY06838.1 hypothetical protein Acsp01_72170 [Actinoplanes sp. NBRC 101535]
MTLTLRALAETSTADFTSAAEAWARLAVGLDNGFEKYVAAAGELPYVWPTGTEAEERSGRLRAEASNAHEPCQRISRALRTHADTVRSLQNMLADIRADAAREGLDIDMSTGVVSAAAGTVDDASDVRRVEARIRNYAGQLTEVLERAYALDRETSAELDASVPALGSGFGGTTGPAITEADLATQSGRTPAQVHDWWESLTRDQQDQAMRDFPQTVGWLDGVPAIDRDKANRTALQHEKEDLIERLNAGGSWDANSDLNEQLQRVYKIEDTLKGLGESGFLLGFDTTAYDGHGKVVIAVNNPDTARHTGVWVPGLSTTLWGSMDDNMLRMKSLNESADALTRDRQGDVSTVYWLGYDAPDLDNVSVLQEDRSKAGRDPYLGFVQGLRATHEGEPGHLVAMGHSYGTTVVGEAAKTGGLPVDDIVVAGSPGMHVAGAGDLMADPRHVWAGASGTDPVAEAGNARPWSGIAAGIAFGAAGPIVLAGAEYGLDELHGIAPTDASFGGNNWVADTDGHTSYWDAGSESLSNQARILAGQYDLVTLNSGERPENVR